MCCYVLLHECVASQRHVHVHVTCVAICCHVLSCVVMPGPAMCVVICCRVVLCCYVLLCVAMCCYVLLCVAMCCYVLYRVNSKRHD